MLLFKQRLLLYFSVISITTCPIGTAKSTLNLALFVSTKQETYPPCQGISDINTYYRVYLASKYAIDQINQQPQLLPNITLKAYLLDTCYTETVIIKNTILRITPYWPNVESIPHLCGSSDPDKIPVIAAVHGGWSREALQLSKLLQLNKIPLISLGATTPELSNAEKHPYFARLVPTDDVAALAVVRLLKNLGWKFVALLFLDDSYGSSFSERFLSEAASNDICIGMSERLKAISQRQEIVSTYQNIRKITKLSVIIAAVSTRIHIQPIIEEMIKDNNYEKYVFIFTDSFNVEDLKVSPTEQSVSIRGYYTFFPLFINKDYDAYMNSLSVNDSRITDDVFYRQVVGDYYKCSDTSSTMESCQYNSLMSRVLKEMGDPKTKIYNAITTDTFNLYAKTIHKIIQANCAQAFLGSEIPKDCISPDKFFQTMIQTNEYSSTGRRLKFKSNGDAVDVVAYMEFKITQQSKYVKYIGLFNEGNVSLNYDETFWVKEPTLGPKYSNCIESCGVDEISIGEEVSCCSGCWKCRDNEIKNANGTKCVSCPTNFWPDELTRSFCYALQPELVITRSSLFLGVVASAGGGQLLTVLVFAFFWINRHKKLLKATSIPTSFGLLLAISLIFAQSVFFLLPPDGLICTAKLLFFHFTYSLIYGLLLIKLLRIFLIFRAANNFSKAKNLGNGSQFLGMIIIVLIQVVLTVAILFAYGSPTSKLIMPLTYIPRVELICTQDSVLLYTPIGYNIIIILITAYLGYATRKLPENFKETLNIFVCAVSTVFLWISFLPMYNFLTSNYVQVLIFLINIHFSGYFYIFGLFIPKIYGIIFLNESQLKVKMWQTMETKMVTEN